jgi:tetratricopeptide (TPR) repeat protein
MKCGERFYRLTNHFVRGFFKLEPTKHRYKSRIRNSRIGEESNRFATVQRLRDLRVTSDEAYLTVFIVCATLLAYWPALRGALLWDDTSHVTSPALQSWRGLWRIWFNPGATLQYYPLTYSAFWFEHRIWGDAVLGYHLTNVTLHIISACLVVVIVRRLRLPGAWLAGSIFALHPVCVEAVAWISEQKSTLSAVFYLGAALAYLHFDTTRQKRHYLFALGLFVLALLGKTVTATLPAALLVILWWQRARLDWRRDVHPLLPWLGLGTAAGLFSAWLERNVVGAHGAEFDLTLAQNLLLAGRVICFYAFKFLWPANLIFTYPHWNIDPMVWWQYFFPAGVLALAPVLWLMIRRGHRGSSAAFLFFIGTLFPVLGFLNIYPFVFSYVADHFQYLANLGLIIPAAFALTVASRRIPVPGAGRMALAVALLVVLGSLTWQQSGTYRDSETLYRATLARNPGSWMAHNNLGVILLQDPRRVADAIVEFQAAVLLKHNFAQAHSNLGNAFVRMPGMLSEAIAEFDIALRINPDLAGTHHNLANALIRRPDRLLQAIAEYQSALRLTPDDAQVHNDLGVALAQIPGRLPDAVSEFQKALRLNPDNTDAHNNLAAMLLQMPGRLPDAIAEFQAVLRLKPDHAQAHFNMGNALTRIPGRLSDAIQELQTAVRIQPDFAEAHNALGFALAKLPGRLPNAIAEYQAALRINPNYAQAGRNLANALNRKDRTRRRERDAISADHHIAPKPRTPAAHDATRDAHARR